MARVLPCSNLIHVPNGNVCQMYDTQQCERDGCKNKADLQSTYCYVHRPNAKYLNCTDNGVYAYMHNYQFGYCVAGGRIMNVYGRYDTVCMCKGSLVETNNFRFDDTCRFKLLDSTNTIENMFRMSNVDYNCEIRLDYRKRRVIACVKSVGEGCELVLRASDRMCSDPEPKCTIRD